MSMARVKQVKRGIEQSAKISARVPSRGKDIRNMLKQRHREKNEKSETPFDFTNYDDDNTYQANKMEILKQLRRKRKKSKVSKKDIVSPKKPITKQPYDDEVREHVSLLNNPVQPQTFNTSYNNNVYENISPPPPPQNSEEEAINNFIWDLPIDFFGVNSKHLSTSHEADSPTITEQYTTLLPSTPTTTTTTTTTTTAMYTQVIPTIEQHTTTTYPDIHPATTILVNSTTKYPEMISTIDQLETSSPPIVEPSTKDSSLLFQMVDKIADTIAHPLSPIPSSPRPIEEAEEVEEEEEEELSDPPLKRKCFKRSLIYMKRNKKSDQNPHEEKRTSVYSYYDRDIVCHQYDKYRELERLYIDKLEINKNYLHWRSKKFISDLMEKRYISDIDKEERKKHSKIYKIKKYRSNVL